MQGFCKINVNLGLIVFITIGLYIGGYNRLYW